jgi:site-specific DNA-methyltransferase (adenine-specific)
MEINKIYQGDCLEVMKDIPDKSVDLIVTSPPYNKGFWSKNRNLNNGFKTKSRRIEYGEYNDCVSPQEYENNQREFIKECLRILKPTGSLFYNHIDILSEHQTKHPKWVYDFPLKQIIIWNRKNTPKLDKSYFFPINEYIFWIQKSDKSRAYFNRKNSIFNKSIWDLSPDTKNKFPAPFPIEIPLNCILSCTKEGDIVLDPFSGSGTTAVACIKTNRNFIGIELSEEYCKIANERLSKLNNGNEDSPLGSKGQSI